MRDYYISHKIYTPILIVYQLLYKFVIYFIQTSCQHFRFSSILKGYFMVVEFKNIMENCAKKFADFLESFLHSNHI